MALNREKVIRTAEKYVSKGKLENAINEYRKVLRENPNDANTLNRVGDLYARIQRIDEAVKLFSQIAEQYTRDGFFVKAIAIYKKIIKLDPTVLQVYERLAELYHKQGLLNEARTQYQVLADYYQKHQNATSATTIYQRMVEMEPDNPSYHLKLAELYQSQKLTDKALRSYRQLADLLMVNGSVEEASQVYLRALEVGASDLSFVREAVSGLVDGGHAEAAQKVFARATELNPEAKEIEGAVGLGRAEPDLDETTFAPSAGAGPPPADVAFAEAEAFEIDAGDDTFDVDFDDPSFDLDAEVELELDEEPPPGREGPVEVEEARRSLAADAEDADESVTFDISLEDDDLSGSMVAPPEDMDSTGTAWQRTEDEDEVDWGTPDGEPDLEIELEPPDDEIFEIEVDLGDDESSISVDVEDAEPAREEVREPEPEPAQVHRPEDLLDEARVFAKYGLRDKARARVDQLLEVEPEHPGGMGLRAEMALEEGDAELAADLGVRLAASVAEGAEVEGWDALRGRMEEQGIALPAAEAAPEPSEPEPELEDRPEPEVEEFDLPDDIEVEDEAVAVEPTEFEPGLDEFELPTLDPDGDLDTGPVPIRSEATPVEAEPVAAEAPPEVAPEPPAVTAPPPEPTPPSSPAPAPARVSSADKKRKDRISKLLDDLDLDGLGIKKPKKVRTPPAAVEPPAAAAAAPPAAAPPAAAPSVAEPPPFEEPPSAPPPAAPPAPTPAAPRQKVSLVDELGLDELDDELGGVFEDAKARARSSTESVTTGEAPSADPDDTGMSWLDEPADGGDAASAASTEALFDDEDDFFDLASELEKELSEDELEDEPEVVVNQEQSLEEIIDGFKKGVAENLSPEDFDTHFNLGIAYREMGLIDEAIGEFQLSSKDDRYLVDSSSMLGMCFLEKGLPDLALRWYRKGLEAPTIEEGKTLGLLYEMGNTYLGMGDDDAAYRTFAEIYGIDSTFRDVSSRLEELRPAAN